MLQSFYGQRGGSGARLCMHACKRAPCMCVFAWVHVYTYVRLGVEPGIFMWSVWVMGNGLALHVHADLVYAQLSHIRVL